MPNEDEPITRVLDEEVVFRAVRDLATHHQCDRHGKLTLKQSAFNDRDQKASVNRASMCPEAADSRLKPDDGVVRLVAVEVRRLSGQVVSQDEKGRELWRHEVDVRHDPLPDNRSHALVETDPQIASGSAWKRLKEALCRIAEVNGWVAPPASVRGGGR